MKTKPLEMYGFSDLVAYANGITSEISLMVRLIIMKSTSHKSLSKHILKAIIAPNYFLGTQALKVKPSHIWVKKIKSQVMKKRASQSHQYQQSLRTSITDS